jgi:RNA polymerase sigma-70 factor (ECF subfamily)
MAVYDAALPYVFGYLLPRCGGQRALAEDLTAETWLAAVDAVRRNQAPPVSTPWLIGIARHKLVDHYRRREREERGLKAVAGTQPALDDPWEAEIDSIRAQGALDRLSPLYRLALTLRYLDDLPVVEVADLVDRGLHATEGLLMRAKAAFRKAYEAQEGCDG